MASVLVTISLTPETKRILNKMAADENRSASNMVETLIIRAKEEHDAFMRRNH